MFQWAITTIFLIIASHTDIKLNKIKNKYILIAIVLGFSINFIQFGLSGLLIAVIGFIIPLAIGYPLFLLGFIPAGDVKMFIAIGVINGINNLNSIFIITLFISGFYSIILLLIKKDFSGLVQLYKYLKNTIITQNFSRYNTNQSIRYPLAPLTLIGYLLFIFIFNML